MSRGVWLPTYTISPAIARALMQIESALAIVGETRLPPATEAALRRGARIRSTHYSTQIEGNRLTLDQAAEVLGNAGMEAPSERTRDVLEVKHYWDALDRVEAWAERREPLTESLIRRLHATVDRGRRAKPTAYRTRQNVVRDSASGTIIYLPPEAHDVPKLMGEMVRWEESAVRDGIPVPIIAGLLHYQFVTIHPYYDGNGRTARLLATFILQREGYGLNGFMSLEEYHARDLAMYYAALMTHPHHNYYEGRGETDLTGWVEYFVTVMARVFDAVRVETTRLAQEKRSVNKHNPPLPQDRRARAMMAVLAERGVITANDVAATLGVSPRQARNYLAEWVRDGWLVATSMARKNRAYRLVT